MCMTSCKKKGKKIPVDFSHYAGEFEFVCSTEPDVWSCQTDTDRSVDPPTPGVGARLNPEAVTQDVNKTDLSMPFDKAGSLIIANKFNDADDVELGTERSPVGDCDEKSLSLLP